MAKYHYRKNDLKLFLRPFWHKLRRFLAYFWLNIIHKKTIQIAITGSYGKTSTTNIVATMLNNYGKTIKTHVDLDTVFNVPITALKLKGHKYIVFELGIDKKNEMDFHLDIVKPHIAVITGIAPVHADNRHLGSLENIITEKRKLIECLTESDFAILNRDDPNVVSMADFTKAHVIWYGTSTESEYRIENVHITLEGTTFTIITPKEKLNVSWALLGKHNSINALVAVIIADILDIPYSIVMDSFKSIQPLPGRFSIKTLDGIVIIDDSLRSNPASARAGVDFLRELDFSGSKIVVFGEMGELGVNSISIHQSLGKKLATSDIDILIGVGGLTKEMVYEAIKQGMNKEKTYYFPSILDAGRLLKKIVHGGDLLYIKGSRLKHMERILLLLQGADVKCDAVSCPFFVDCKDCDYRTTGYKK